MSNNTPSREVALIQVTSQTPPRCAAAAVGPVPPPTTHQAVHYQANPSSNAFVELEMSPSLVIRFLHLIRSFLTTLFSPS